LSVQTLGPVGIPLQPGDPTPKAYVDSGFRRDVPFVSHVQIKGTAPGAGVRYVAGPWFGSTDDPAYGNPGSEGNVLTSFWPIDDFALVRDEWIRAGAVGNTAHRIYDVTDDDFLWEGAYSPRDTIRRETPALPILINENHLIWIGFQYQGNPSTTVPDRFTCKYYWELIKVNEHKKVLRDLNWELRNKKIKPRTAQAYYQEFKSAYEIP